jgi:hypothetical protein
MFNRVQSFSEDFLLSCYAETLITESGYGSVSEAHFGGLDQRDISTGTAHSREFADDWVRLPHDPSSTSPPTPSEDRIKKFFATLDGGRSGVWTRRKGGNTP